MKSVLFALVLCLPVWGYTQSTETAPAAPSAMTAPPATPAAAAVVAVPAPTPAPVAAVEPAPTEDEVKVTVDGDKVTVGDVVVSAGDVMTAVKDYQSSAKAGKRLALMVLLTAIFKLLLSGLKVTSPFWKSNKGKTILRLSTITLGLAVTFFSHMGMGSSWYDAIVIGLSGPLAVAFHEYSLLIPILSKKKAEAAAKG